MHRLFLESNGILKVGVLLTIHIHGYNSFISMNFLWHEQTLKYMYSCFSTDLRSLIRFYKAYNSVPMSSAPDKTEII